MGENPDRISSGKRIGGKPGPDYARKTLKKINPRAQTLTNSTPAAWSFHPH